MPENEFVVVRDRWSLGRRPRLRLSSSRVLPGPLKSLPRHRPAPTRATGFALTGLSLAAALVLAPQLRGAAPKPALVAEAAPEPAREAAPTPRIVGAAPAAVDTASLPAAPVAAVPTPAESPVAAVVEPVPVAPARHAAAPALDLGTLPVLELDAAAFEAPVPAEPAPRAGRVATPRAAAPRLAGQP